MPGDPCRVFLEGQEAETQAWSISNGAVCASSEASEAVKFRELHLDRLLQLTLKKTSSHSTTHSSFPSTRNSLHLLVRLFVGPLTAGYLLCTTLRSCAALAGFPLNFPHRASTGHLIFLPESSYLLRPLLTGFRGPLPHLSVSSPDS